MEALQTFGSAMGLGLLAGIRLYATVFALGLAMRLGWFHLGPEFDGLAVVASTPALVASGLACFIEFLADKIPWVDSMWDSIHTFIRPVGAALLGAATLGSFDPSLRFVLALLCGGVALTGHSSKAATRLAVNGSPEPFTNIALSLAEDLAVPAGMWLLVQHPLVTLAFVGIFVALFAWLSPRVIRLITLSLTAMKALLRRWFGTPEAYSTPPIAPHPALTDGFRKAFAGRALVPLPADMAKRAQAISGVSAAVRSGALRNSTGFFVVMPDRFEFVAKRWFRTRVEQIPFDDITQVRYRGGIFLDRFTFSTSRHEHEFDFFKTPRCADATVFEEQPSRVR